MLVIEMVEEEVMLGEQEVKWPEHISQISQIKSVKSDQYWSKDGAWEETFMKNGACVSTKGTSKFFIQKSTARSTFII